MRPAVRVHLRRETVVVGGAAEAGKQCVVELRLDGTDSDAPVTSERNSFSDTLAADAHMHNNMYM